MYKNCFKLEANPLTNIMGLEFMWSKNTVEILCLLNPDKQMKNVAMGASYKATNSLLLAFETTEMMNKVMEE